MNDATSSTEAAPTPSRRRRRPTAAETLRKEPYRFDFFQAVRLLERLFRARRPVGRDAPAEDEVVRFRSLPSLEFPASQIHQLRESTDPDRPLEMVVAFFGLTGLNGALPHHYTEWISERLARKDRTLRDFVDLFNHRLISLFYRAWEKYRYWISSERALVRESEQFAAGSEQYRSYVIDQRPQLDLFGQMLLDFAGMGGPALRYRSRVRSELQSRTGIADDTVRFYCGLFAQQRRSAIGLEGLLEGYFGCAIRVEQLCGQWLLLDDADRSRLGSKRTSIAGETAVAGGRVWDVAGKFRITAGPLTFAEFCDFLPIGSAHGPMVELGRLYAGMQFDFDLELILKAGEVPRMKLGKDGGIGARLGWTTWCRTARFEQGEGRVVLAAGR
jgi:type VI secretion system protein ImpH